MRGLFIGRFQPFHRGHASIIRSALEEVDDLVVVLGSAEVSHTPGDPFTAGERMEMLLIAAREMGIHDRIIPVPVRDINRYAVWVDHVISYVPRFDTVFTNNSLTRTLFEARGFEVRSTPLVDRTLLSGKSIRERMVRGEEWIPSVEPAVADYIISIGGDRRIRDLSSKGDES